MVPGGLATGAYAACLHASLAWHARLAARAQCGARHRGLVAATRHPVPASAARSRRLRLLRRAAGGPAARRHTSTHCRPCGCGPRPHGLSSTGCRAPRPAVAAATVLVPACGCATGVAGTPAGTPGGTSTWRPARWPSRTSLPQPALPAGGQAVPAPGRRPQGARPARQPGLRPAAGWLATWWRYPGPGRRHGRPIPHGRGSPAPGGQAWLPGGPGCRPPPVGGHLWPWGGQAGLWPGPGR